MMLSHSIQIADLYMLKLFKEQLIEWLWILDRFDFQPAFHLGSIRVLVSAWGLSKSIQWVCRDRHPF